MTRAPTPEPSARNASFGSDLERGLLTLLKWAGLPAPVTQHRFHPTRRWRFDAAYPDRLIGIEVDGGTWVQGRHARGSGIEGDAEKYTEAAILGWRVLRLTKATIEDRTAADYVGRALRWTGCSEWTPDGDHCYICGGLPGAHRGGKP